MEMDCVRKAISPSLPIQTHVCICTYTCTYIIAIAYTSEGTCALHIINQLHGS